MSLQTNTKEFRMPALGPKSHQAVGMPMLGIQRGGRRAHLGKYRSFGGKGIRIQTSASMTGLQAAMSPADFLDMIQPPSILAFNNPFTAAPVPPPNFFESLAARPVETLTQNPLGIQGPNLGSVFGFLLSNPLITLVFAVGLYIVIPRLWRLLVRWILIPAGFVGAGIVVFKNPSFFTNAGSFVAGFSTDHPYITSAAILGTLGIILSPYVLTALVLLLVFTGVPKLPAPLRGFLPAPFLEVEETLRGADSVIRGPVEKAKEQAFRAGDDFREKSFDFLGQKVQGLPSAPEISDQTVKR